MKYTRRPSWKINLDLFQAKAGNLMPQTLLMLLVYLSIDPFADATKGDDRLPGGTDEYIHIRIQQRNGRKTLTTVQGIADGYDKKKLVKAFKKVVI